MYGHCYNLLGNWLFHYQSNYYLIKATGLHNVCTLRAREQIMTRAVQWIVNTMCCKRNGGVRCLTGMRSIRGLPEEGLSKRQTLPWLIVSSAEAKSWSCSYRLTVDSNAATKQRLLLVSPVPHRAEIYNKAVYPIDRRKHKCIFVIGVQVFLDATEAAPFSKLFYVPTNYQLTDDGLMRENFSHCHPAISQLNTVVYFSISTGATQHHPLPLPQATAC